MKLRPIPREQVPSCFGKAGKTWANDKDFREAASVVYDHVVEGDLSSAKAQAKGRETLALLAARFGFETKAAVTDVAKTLKVITRGFDPDYPDASPFPRWLASFSRTPLFVGPRPACLDAPGNVWSPDESKEALDHFAAVNSPNRKVLRAILSWDLSLRADSDQRTDEEGLEGDAPQRPLPDIDDFLQDFFAKAWFDSVTRYFHPARGSFEHFLVFVMLRCFHRWLKQFYRRHKEELLPEPMQNQFGMADGHEESGPASEREACKQALPGALSKLKPYQRLLVTLKYVDQLSYEQISQHPDVRIEEGSGTTPEEQQRIESNLRQKVCRALSAMRRWL